MFDNLRQKSAEEAEFLNKADEPAVAAAPAPVAPRQVAPRRGYAFGLSPIQRFVLALMLFLNVSVLGCFALAAFGKIDLFQLLTVFY
jgi:hypothetical protein